MTASLPSEVQSVFDRFITTEYTTIDRTGQPITWPVTPYYRPGAGAIDVTTGIGYPKKADDAAANPRVALLFSDPTGCGIEARRWCSCRGPPKVDDADLDANARRYQRESLEKLPATKDQMPPDFLRRFFTWYFARLYVYVRPERVYVWSGGDVVGRTRAATTCTSRRSARATPRSRRRRHPRRPAGPKTWDERMDELGARYPRAVLSFVAPDGFPFSVRLPVTRRPRRPPRAVRCRAARRAA